MIATNLPMAGPVAFDERTRPRCHVAMAFRAKPSAAIDGMFIGIDEPTHSLRMGRDAQGLLLVALGPTFYTGQDGDVAERFCQLESWVRHNLPVEEAAWRWVNEDYNTADRVPYVGVPSAETDNFYIATGFNGWGISNGTAAGMLIADQILGRPNPWTALYDPRRPSPKGFNQGGDTQSRVRALGDILPGEGGVLKVGKEDVAVWKEDDRDAACIFRSMHAQRMHADMEQCRPDLGLPLSRVDLLSRRKHYSWSGGGTARSALPAAALKKALRRRTPSLLCGSFDLP